MAADKKISIGQAIDQVLSALEGFDGKARATILNVVSTHLGVSNPPHSRPEVVAVEVDATSKGPTPARQIATVDIRTLKEEKAPRTAIQMACVVAYYLSEYLEKPTITAEDVEKYFKQARFKLPKNTGQVLIDAKFAGYMDNAVRGSYTLNAVGYNLVAHSLPRPDAK